MEKTNAQGEVLGRRDFYLEDRPPDVPEVSVVLHRPFQDKTGYYRCCYEICRPQPAVYYTTGLDVLDSILRALRLLGSRVAELNDTLYGGRLRWVDLPPGQFGLPRVEDNWGFVSQEGKEDDKP